MPNVKYFCPCSTPVESVAEGVAVIRQRPRDTRSLSLRLVALVVVVVTGVLAVLVAQGCTRSVDGTAVRSSTHSAQPNRDYDISRLEQLQDEFPPGFNHVRATPLGILGPAADKFSNIGLGNLVAIEPPNCRPLLQPVRPPRDAQFTMVIGMGNGALVVSAVKSPEPFPETGPPPGCEHASVTRRLSGRQYDSTVTHLSGPSIDGVTTTGSSDSAGMGGTKTFVYAGFLSDRVAVAV